MWRFAGLAVVAAMSAILFACGSGGSSDGTPQACGDYTAIISDAATARVTLPQGYSVEEAKQRVDWFRFPSDLPPDATVRPVNIWHVYGCPSAITVGVRVEGPGYWIYLEEGTGLISGDKGTPVEVDGTTGWMQTDTGNLEWQRGHHPYLVTTKYGGALTRDRLLRVLDSMR